MLFGPFSKLSTSCLGARWSLPVTSAWLLNESKWQKRNHNQCTNFIAACLYFPTFAFIRVLIFGCKRKVLPAMDPRERAGRAHKSVSREALRKQGVEEPRVKAAGASHRCMRKSRIVKGRTPEEQQRINEDNAAMAAAARKREKAVRQEQKARKKALARALCESRA